MRQVEGLWRENTDAWHLYQLLGGRTVQACQLGAWLLERWTADWELDRVVDLVTRLNLIVGILEPAHGPAQNRHRS